MPSTYLLGKGVQSPKVLRLLNSDALLLQDIIREVTAVVPCGPQVPLEVTERLHTEAEPVVDSEAETVAVVDSVAEECKFLLPDKFFPQKHRIINLIYFQVFYADNLIFCLA